MIKRPARRWRDQALTVLDQKRVVGATPAPGSGAGHTFAPGGQMAAEQHQGHTAGRQGIKQLLGGHDVAAHGSTAVGLQQFFGAHVVAVDQPLASGEPGQCCLGFEAAPLQIRLDPLLLAPWQELELQISNCIQLIAEQEPLGLAAQ